MLLIAIQTLQILTLKIIEEANKTFVIYDNKCEISNKTEMMDMWDVNTNKILIFHWFNTIELYV